MKTNDIKKGAIVLTRLGQRGEVLDNRRGNLRMVRINEDVGDIYAHDIMHVMVGDDWESVELTEKQMSFSASVSGYVSG